MTDEPGASINSGQDSLRQISGSGDDAEMPVSQSEFQGPAGGSGDGNTSFDSNKEHSTDQSDNSFSSQPHSDETKEASKNKPQLRVDPTNSAALGHQVPSQDELYKNYLAEARAKHHAEQRNVQQQREEQIRAIQNALQQERELNARRLVEQQIKIDEERAQRDHEKALNELRRQLMQEQKGPQSSLQSSNRNMNRDDSPSIEGSNGSSTVGSQASNVMPMNMPGRSENQGLRKSPRNHSSSRAFAALVKQEPPNVSSQPMHLISQGSQALVSPPAVDRGASAATLGQTTPPDNMTVRKPPVLSPGSKKRRLTATSAALDEMMAARRSKGSKQQEGNVHDQGMTSMGLQTLRAQASMKQQLAKELDSILKETMKPANNDKIEQYLDSAGLDASKNPKPYPTDTFFYNISLYLPECLESNANTRAEIVRKAVIDYAISQYGNFTEVSKDLIHLYAIISFSAKRACKYLFLFLTHSNI